MPLIRRIPAYELFYGNEASWLTWPFLTRARLTLVSPNSGASRALSGAALPSARTGGEFDADFSHLGRAKIWKLDEEINDMQK
jgi:hypothetical protein